MRIWPGVEAIEPYPAAFIKQLDSIVIADLHLGYEGIMAEQGVFIPKVQFEQEMGLLKGILKSKEASRIVINGDVKHEFSETSYHEFVEVTELFKFLSERFREVILIKGNHDNYIIRVTKKYGIKLFDELRLGDFFFLHGHKVPKNFGRIEAKHVVIAHEHPAIALYDEIGGKEKIDCFLYGALGDKKLLVLPAFSTLAEGSQVNAVPSSELLSPILRELADIGEFKAIGVSEETGCLRFPELKNLRF